MTKKEMIKAGAKILVSAGVGTIVCNAVAFTTPAMTMGLLKRTVIAIGSFALSAFASDKVANYTDEKIDEVFDEVDKAIKETNADNEIEL